MDKTLHAISAGLNRIGVAVLFLLMILTSADVFMRYLFNRPIKGTFELTELMMVVTVFFALAYTESKKGHVSVELVIERLPQRSQAVIDALTSLLSLIIISVIVWQGFLFAHETMLSGEHSAILGIPLFYFKALVPLGALVLCLEILISIINALRRTAKK